MNALRDYQQGAVDAVWEYLAAHKGKSPCVVIPTGGGKTPVIAELCRQACSPEWAGRVLVLAHQKELLEQAGQKLTAFAPEIRFGIYSASIGSRDTSEPVVLCQIQSARRIGAGAFGRRDLILVDEAHLIPASGDGQYRTFLQEARAATPHVRLVGLTATPYRLGSGMIIGGDQLLDEICYEVGVRELMDRGYLTRLISKPGIKGTLVDLSDVKTTGGDFNEGDLGRAMSRGRLIPDTVDDVLDKADGRKAGLIFCTTIDHGEKVVRELRDRGQRVEFITGETGGLERTWLLSEFRAGGIRWLVNVGTLTTGVDCPNIDCVVLLRPTKSTGLYYQMVGRGFRIHPDKADCLVLDYGRNIALHGPVDNLVSKPGKAGSKGGGPAPMRTCGECKEVCHAGLKACPYCGFEFPIGEIPEATHDTRADEDSPIISEPEAVHEVGEVLYSVHQPQGKRALDADGRPKPPSMRVDYFRKGEYDGSDATLLQFRLIVSEWVCLEHEGFARAKAVVWWRLRSNDPVPATIEDAVSAANAGALAFPKAVTVKLEPGSKWKRITKVELGPKPEVELDGALRLEREAEEQRFLDELPF